MDKASPEQLRRSHTALLDRLARRARATEARYVKRSLSLEAANPSTAKHFATLAEMKRKEACALEAGAYCLKVQS